MNNSRRTLARALVSSSIALLLAACGGGGGGGGASTGSLSISITDAAVDMADEVVVEFDGVEIQPAEGDRILFDFTDRCNLDPASCQIDLLALSDGTSEFLLEDEEVPSGRYSWARLRVNAEPGVRDSYIVIGGMEYEMIIPSGAQSGLKLNRGFVVPAGGVADFTIDFDLRKSVNDPKGLTDASGNDVYRLRPTLRLVDNAEIGRLKGSVDPALIEADCAGAVYVFEAGATPDDEDGDIGGDDPVTTALLGDDQTYKVSFLAPGDYVAAFTCDADEDDPETDDAGVVFSSQADVSIVVDQDTVHNFIP